MRKLFASLLLAYSLAGSGCSFVYNMRNNIVHEPIYACDELQIAKRNRAVADEAFGVMTNQYGCDFSVDYRCGFIDGFADYLTYGGCVDSCGDKPVTPPVPPEKYRRKQYMTPAGYQAMEDWFAGFRHGASTAQASGLRQLVVLPVIVPPRFGPDDAMKADYKPSANIPGGKGGEPPLGGSLPPKANEATLPDPKPLPGPDATPPANNLPATPAAPPTTPAAPPAPPPAGPPPAPPVKPMSRSAEHPF